MYPIIKLKLQKQLLMIKAYSCPLSTMVVGGEEWSPLIFWNLQHFSWIVSVLGLQLLLLPVPIFPADNEHDLILFLNCFHLKTWKIILHRNQAPQQTKYKRTREVKFTETFLVVISDRTKVKRCQGKTIDYLVSSL